VVHRAKSLCDRHSWHGELKFLKTAFRQNGYSDRQIRGALNRPDRVAPPPEITASVALQPYISTTFNIIGRLVSRHNVKSVGLPPEQIPSFLRRVKVNLELKAPGAYRVPY
jgi:hypothetical protein